MMLDERPSMPKHRCKNCGDTGIIELAGVTPAVWAWQTPFTTMPCLCEIGREIEPTHTAAANDPDWKHLWEKSHGSEVPKFEV